MSEIRVTSIVGENGGDRVGLTTGLTVGPLTGTTGIGATITHQGHAQFAGVCTATSFFGNGANLTGVDPITAFTQNEEGYVKFSNGFTIAWGRSAGTSAETDVTWTYPVTFSTVYRVIHGTQEVNGSSDGMMQLKSFSTTAAIFRHNKFNSASGTAYATCIAIGKIN